MTKPLRLLNRQSKPHRHLGIINSDAVVGRYLDEVERLPVKYAVVVSRGIPLWRRAWRWVGRLLS